MDKKPISLQRYICIECQNGYIAKAQNQKYCSADCQKENRKNRLQIKTISKKCHNSECAKNFKVSLQSDPKIYCSKSCATHVNNHLKPKRSAKSKCKECKIAIRTKEKYCKNHKPVWEKECVLESCNNKFQTSNNRKKYCSEKCCDKAGHARYLKNANLHNKCECGALKYNRSKYCLGCAPRKVYEKNVQAWLKGDVEGGSVRGVSTYVKKYVLEQADYKCRVCGFNESHPSDGRTVLEVNHIDGDGSNHRPENLEVLCPNHHALTPNYRARNKGNGRKVYYLRVAK